MLSVWSLLPSSVERLLIGRYLALGPALFETLVKDARARYRTVHNSKPAKHLTTPPHFYCKNFILNVFALCTPVCRRSTSFEVGKERMVKRQMDASARVFNVGL